MSRRGLEQLRERFVEEGFETTLNGKGKGRRPRSIRGEDEARLIALVCGPKPEGRSRWALSLLAEEWSVLANTDTKKVSRETIRQALKKTGLNLGGALNGVFRQDETGRETSAGGYG
jgi:hypothetical protein